MKKTTLRETTTVLAKILELLSFTGSGMTLSSLITLAILLATGHINQQLLTDVLTNPQVNYYGSSVILKNGQLFIPGIFICFGSLAIQFILFGFIFHNVGKIFALKAGSPFSAENVKRIKYIGYLALALPIVKLALSIFGMIFGVSPSMGVSAYEFLFALVALSLSQYFAYGAELEKDVDGLL